MVQEGLRKRLILSGGQNPDHALHSFAGPAPPLPFHAIAVEPVIRFCSTQVDFCMDAALAQAWDIGNNKNPLRKDPEWVCYSPLNAVAMRPRSAY